jgi:hypothetical protein
MAEAAAGTACWSGCPILGWKLGRGEKLVSVVIWVKMTDVACAGEIREDGCTVPKSGPKSDSLVGSDPIKRVFCSEPEFSRKTGFLAESEALIDLSLSCPISN